MNLIGSCGFPYGRHFHTGYGMFPLWFTELRVTVHWITMETYRIPNEKACRTGVRKLPYIGITTLRFIHMQCDITTLRFIHMQYNVTTSRFIHMQYDVTTSRFIHMQYRIPSDFTVQMLWDCILLVRFLLVIIQGCSIANYHSSEVRYCIVQNALRLTLP